MNDREREIINQWRQWRDARARLTGDGQPQRRGSIPLPVEVAAVIADAQKTVIKAASDSIVHCGEHFPGAVAGDPVRCTLVQGHTRKIKHRNHELRVAWWGNDVAS